MFSLLLGIENIRMPHAQGKVKQIKIKKTLSRTSIWSDQNSVKKNIVPNAYRVKLLLEALDFFMLAIIFAFIAANVTNGHAITHLF